MLNLQQNMIISIDGKMIASGWESKLVAFLRYNGARIRNPLELSMKKMDNPTRRRYNKK
jgi:hypothetical protein